MEINVDKLDFNELRIIDETGEYAEFDLKKELSFNEYNLDKEMMEQPSKYIYWSSILEKLRLFLESSELELQMLTARLDKEARENLPLENIKVTKDAVEGYIYRTEEYLRAVEKRNQYTYLVKRLQFIVKSFEQRKDMIQSFSKKQTTEYTYGHKAGRGQEATPEIHENPFPRFNE